ncbi:hypothetical protein [Sphingomonas sp. BK069]|uniref:hypothetical protein n=1 Tax=Sphingomonas sp. BK069 TaxID=2586979 RepID=UPI0017BD67FB|nr:hypothetical protein [Sphingomonas sp. BK069]MBB3348399.1 hypothetical protein [Sphingomonas sp. BK069]
MYADVNAPQALRLDTQPTAYDMPDPLDPDSPQDAPFTVTRRRLIRLALVAAETGARFQRESLEHDPMAWLLAPRLIFDGVDGVEGALDLQGCLRAILLHGLSLGLDADPEVFDELLSDDLGSAAARCLMN